MKPDVKINDRDVSCHTGIMKGEVAILREGGGKQKNHEKKFKGES